MWSYRCVERGLSARDHRAPRRAQTPHGPLAARYLLLMPLTRDDIRESVERAGDEHWDALRRHHEDAYPNPKPTRSEEHTSELQSHSDLVCRLLLEKKKTKKSNNKYRQTQQNYI